MNYTLAQTLIKPSVGSRVLAINFWKAYSTLTGETKGKLGLYKWIDTLYTRKRGVICDIELIVHSTQPKQELKQISAILEERNAKLEQELAFMKDKLANVTYENALLKRELEEKKKELEEKEEELKDMEEQLDNFAIETEPYDVLEIEEVDVMEHEEEDYATEDEDDNAVRICLETIQKKYEDILNKLSEAGIEVIQLVEEQISNLSPEVVEAEGLRIAERIINEMTELLSENGEEELYLQQQVERAEQARIIQQEKMERRRQLAMGEIEPESEAEDEPEDDDIWGGLGL